MVDIDLSLANQWVHIFHKSLNVSIEWWLQTIEQSEMLHRGVQEFPMAFPPVAYS